MSKILLINFESTSSILRSLDLVKSINTQAPNTEVHLLTSKELKLAGMISSLLTETHFIDSKRIADLISDNMIPDTMGLDCFLDSLELILETKWHTVVNFSMDAASKQLTSMIAAKDGALIIGPSAGISTPNIQSDIWTTIGNEIPLSYAVAPVNKGDSYIKAMRIDNPQETNEDSIRIKDKFTKQTFNAFKKIRSANGQNCRIVGIQLKGLHKGREIPFEDMCSLLNTILDDPTLYPVLLIRPEEEGRAYAREINRKFGDCLVIIESDLLALPSITMNLDALISPESECLSMAEITRTPVIEISMGTSGFKSFSSTRESSWVLRVGPKSTDITMSILSAIHVALSDTCNYSSKHNTLFQVSKDAFGTHYQWVSGQLDAMELLDYTMSRHHVSRFSGRPLALKNLLNDLPLSASILEPWTSGQREFATHVSRDLLGALRSLIRVQKEKKHAPEFVSSLSKLFCHIDVSALVSIPTNLFSTRLESLEGRNFIDNIKIIERALYQFKDEVQLIVNQIKDIEQIARAMKNQEMIDRANLQPSSNKEGIWIS
ncbi:MAG: hypothetical protein KAG61_01070 [Bacteriovoracaceae bacterium]|nr:hypothetical protein [Bacteriovoracaceae bacterium]